MIGRSRFSDNHYLLSADDNEYSASGEETLALDPEGEGFFTEIDPGNAVEGTMVFDVPATAGIQRALLPDLRDG